jgi:hypothetical protein
MSSFPVLPESGGFFVFRHRAGLPIINLFARIIFPPTILKDQHIMKSRSLALASWFALSVNVAIAATITEDFSADPMLHGWQIFGNTNLFHWNAAHQNVEVTWDSTNQNSYLALPLGTVLARDDDFSVSFDLQLNDAVIWNYGNQIAVGLFNWAQATNATFARASGASPNLFEFDYFLDTGYGDSMNATLMDTNGDFSHLYFTYDNQTLVPGITYRITLSHAAGTTNLTGQIFSNGVLLTSLPISYPATITDFRLDTLSISSYADDGFGDSVLAHGVVDNFTVTLPPPPVQNFAGDFQGSQWRAQFVSCNHWLYALERSSDLQHWTTVASGIVGTGSNLSAIDSAPPTDQACYRIRAERP